MENQFIPYEEALLLKDLGFDEECLGVWDNQARQLFLNDTRELTIKDIPTIFTLAPLYQQAFGWFRNHHSLFVNLLTRTSVNEILETDITIVSWKFPPKKIDYFIRYDDAQLEALRALIYILEDEKRS